MGSYRLDSLKIKQALAANGLTVKSFSFSASTYKRMNNGLPMTTLVLHEVAKTLGYSLDDFIAEFEELDARQIVTFKTWYQPDPMKMVEIVRAVRRGERIKVQWPNGVMRSIAVGRRVADELSGVGEPRHRIAALPEESRLWTLRWVRETLDGADRLVEGTVDSIKAVVLGMEHLFGGGASVEGACETLLRLIAARVITDVLDSIHDLVEQSEVEHLTANGVSEWAIGPRGTTYDLYGRVLSLDRPVAVQIISIGDYVGCVDVHSTEDEAWKVLAYGTGPRIVPMAWVHQRAIPFAAFERLVQGETGVVRFDERIHVNKVKHPDGRES